MLVAEVIERKNRIKQKIEELEYYLEKVASIPNVKNSSTVYNEVVNNVFELLDNYQSHVILLDKSNSKTVIKVGQSEIKVSDAIKLHRTINEKMRILTNIITSTDSSVDVPNLIKQRDKLIEERLLLNKSIQQSDWAVEIE